MTERPYVLPETPPETVDPLSDLLGTMHLAGTVLFRAEFREPWAVVTPDSRRLAKVLPFRAERIIPFHIVARGGCWIEMPGHAPVWLREGDAVLLPHGKSHGLRGSVATAAVPVGQLLPAPPWRDVLVVEHGGEGARASVVCGFLHCEALPFDPILQDLPAMLHVGPQPSAEDGWLMATVRRTAMEASLLLPGARNMLPRLTELVFVEILRKHMQSLPDGQVGWLAACKDAVAGPALKLLHEAPAAAWSVEALARRVGVSRTVLAGRFRRLLGLPPMRYLAQWRLQRAARQLVTGAPSVKSVAHEAGYESEAAFSRAFKRHFGLPPRDWRRRQALARG